MRRKNSQAIPEKKIQNGYVQITEKLRVRVEDDCLTLEELTGINNETGENNYGNYKFFSSWNNVLDYLIRKFTAEKIQDKQILTFQEAKQEMLKSIKEVKKVLLGEIEQEMQTANEDIKKTIIKFTR